MGVGEGRAAEIEMVCTAPFQMTLCPIFLGNIREKLGEAGSLMDAGEWIGALGPVAWGHPETAGTMKG